MGPSALCAVGAWRDAAHMNATRTAGLEVIPEWECSRLLQTRQIGRLGRGRVGRGSTTSASSPERSADGGCAMGADAPDRPASRPAEGRQWALEDARRRLVALATGLEPQTADEAALRTTAAELDTV